MDLFLARVLDGLANGSIYASLALAVVLIFRSTGTINLAQGEMAMFTTFLAWKIASPSGGLGLPVVVALLVAMAAGFVGGAAIERVIIRPVEGKESHLPMIIVTLGLFLAIDAVAGRVFTLNTVSLASPFPAGGVTAGGVLIQWSTIGLLLTLVGVSAAMWYLFQHTRIGLAMRATVDNAESALLVGIRRGRVLMVGWGLAAALGSLAGVLIAPVTLVQVPMLQSVLLYGFAAATLGGFESPLGAIVGGLLVGLTEALVSGYVGFIGNQLSLFTALVLIVAVLLVKPTGLFGRADLRRL